jgi:heptosyltransferase-1
VGRPHRPPAGDRRFHRRLRGRRYDLVLDAQGLAKSALVSSWARATRRAGFDFASARERLSALALDQRLRIPAAEHAIARCRHLFAKALGYAPPRGEPDFGLAAERPPNDSVVLAHGTAWRTKHWPEAFWVDLGRRVAAAGLVPAVPWLDGEKPRAMRIAGAVPGARLCPRMDVDGVVQLVSEARGIVGVDSGIAHLGAAFGRPTVMLFGPTDPGLTGCRGAYVRNLSSSLPCAPCESRRCRLPSGQEQAQPDAPPCLTALRPGHAWLALDGLIRRETACRSR